MKENSIMKHAFFLITIIAVLTVSAAISMAGDKSCCSVKTTVKKDSTASADAMMKMQTTCPVMGGKIDKAFFADYQGDRVYFCCEACVAKFNENPELYIKKLKDDGVTPDKTPASN
jgi:YHS domain-containing protein